MSEPAALKSTNTSLDAIMVPVRVCTYLVRSNGLVAVSTSTCSLNILAILDSAVQCDRCTVNCGERTA